jgi:hypothetical protein
LDWRTSSVDHLAECFNHNSHEKVINNVP